MAFVADERKRYTVYPPPDQVFTWTQMCDIRDVSRAAGAGEGWGRSLRRLLRLKRLKSGVGHTNTLI